MHARHLVALCLVYAVGCGNGTSIDEAMAAPPQATSDQQPAAQTLLGDRPDMSKTNKTLAQMTAKELGLADHTPYGTTHRLVIDESMRNTKKNKDGVAKGFVTVLRPSFKSHRCYTIVAVAPKGIQLFLTVGSAGGQVLAHDGDLEAEGAVVGVGFCAARDVKIQLVVLTNLPTTLSYRIFDKPNHMQGEMENDIRERRHLCLRSCKALFESCVKYGEPKCTWRHDTCVDNCNRH
ncbi:MAG: hypothetical protein AB7P03_21355 [Kofleriaceae bacterium]